MKNSICFLITLAAFSQTSAALACTKTQALKAAQEYARAESPKDSKISVVLKKDVYHYTATLIDNIGTYTGSGALKVTANAKKECQVEVINSSRSDIGTNSNSSSSSSIKNK